MRRQTRLGSSLEQYYHIAASSQQSGVVMWCGVIKSFTNISLSGQLSAIVVSQSNQLSHQPGCLCLITLLEAG